MAHIGCKGAQGCWDEQLDGTYDAGIVRYRRAAWLRRFRLHQWADRVEYIAREQVNIGKRMQRCPHNPANGGRGFDICWSELWV